MKPNDDRSESLVDALQSQLALYKTEYETLKAETKSVLAENFELSQRLNTIVAQNDELQNMHVDRESNKEELQSLRKQLALSQKEKNSFESLWRTSQNAIRNLENEMKAYQMIKKSPLPYCDNDEVKYEFASVVKMLESKLFAAHEEIKSKNETAKQTADEFEALKRRLSEKEKSNSDLVEKQNELNLKVGNLEKEIFRLRDELSVSKQNFDEVCNKLEMCRQQVDLCGKKEFESRNKVAEALQLVETAISESNAALEKEKEAVATAASLSQQMTDVLNESTVRVEKELNIAKQAYNEKLNDMLIHIQRLELELGEKNLSLDRAERECSLLEGKIKSKNQSIIDVDQKNSKNEKLLVLEQKLEATFQQLLLSERRNIQIISEKENLQMDLDHLVSNFQRDKRKQEWEEKLHLNEINSLKIQISNLKEALNEAHHSIQKLQTQIISTEELEEKMTTDKFIIASEFEKYFETQQKLNSKWKESMKEMTCVLESRVAELSEQVKMLKKQNSQLRIKIH